MKLISMDELYYVDKKDNDTYYIPIEIFIIVYILCVLAFCLYVIFFVCLRKCCLKITFLSNIKLEKAKQVNECSICLEEIELDQYVRVLTCNHTFHKVCIEKWVEKSLSTDCPFCRQKNISKCCECIENIPSTQTYFMI